MNNQTDLLLASKDRFEILDIARFLAAMAVLSYHFFFRGWAADDLSPLVFLQLGEFAKYGGFGVQFFFMISGFVIFMSAQGKRPTEFVASRVARLYPAYWVAVMLTASIIILFGASKFSVTPSQVVVNLTMLQQFLRVPNVDGVYWTLARELVFYFWIWLLLFFQQTRKFTMFASIFLLFATGAIFIDVPGVVNLLFLLDYACYFVAGACFYLIYREGVTSAKVAMIIWCLLLSINQVLSHLGADEQHYSTSFSILVTINIIVFFYAFFLSVSMGVWKNFNYKYAVPMGALTYPVYLLHENLGFIAFNQLGTYVNKYLLVAMVTAVILFCAYLIVRLVERPFAGALKKTVIICFTSIRRKLEFKKA